MSTAKELLLLTNSTEEQKKWVSRLLKRVPRKSLGHNASIAIASPSSEGSPPMLSPQLSPCLSPGPSPHISPHCSPRLSHRGAVKVHSTRHPPSPKSRWSHERNHMNIWGSLGLLQWPEFIIHIFFIDKGRFYHSKAHDCFTLTPLTCTPLVNVCIAELLMMLVHMINYLFLFNSFIPLIKVNVDAFSPSDTEYALSLDLTVELCRSSKLSLCC